jgi:hypothetical protein
MSDVKKFHDTHHLPDEAPCQPGPIKAKVIQTIQGLLDQRRNGQGLGQIGSVQFQTLDDFLQPFDDMNYKCERIGYGLKMFTPQPGTHRRIVAMGDVHSDLVAFLTLLRTALVIDENYKWIGGNTTVLQLGDVVDRHRRDGITIDSYHNEREELDILQCIHGFNVEAETFGGAVISLTGNHEYGRFLKIKAYKQYQNKDQINTWTSAGGADEFQTKTRLARYFACYKPIILRVNDFIFCHGGLDFANIEHLPKGYDFVSHFNKEWSQYLIHGKSLAQNISDVFFHRMGITSTKDLNDDECFHNVEATFHHMGWNLEHGGLVVAHTVQSNGIALRCHGRVWFIDLGFSEAFGNYCGGYEVLCICIYESGKEPKVEIGTDVQQ